MLLPDHETDVDFLNYEAIAKTVGRLEKLLALSAMC